MKKLILLTPLILFACSSSDDHDCTQKWEYKEYCKSPSTTCGHCTTESNEPINSREFKCEEVSGIKEGQEVYLSERDNGCIKFYRRYIKRLN